MDPLHSSVAMFLDFSNFYSIQVHPTDFFLVKSIQLFHSTHRIKLHLNTVSMSILLQNFLKDENCIFVGHFAASRGFLMFQTNTACIMTQKNAVLIYFMEEA